MKYNDKQWIKILEEFIDTKGMNAEFCIWLIGKQSRDQNVKVLSSM